MNKQTIIDNFFYDNGKRFRQSNHIDNNLLNDLINYTSYLQPDISHVIRCKYVLHDFAEIRKCPVCNNKLNERINETRLLIFCSNNCARKFMLDNPIAQKKRKPTDKNIQERKNNFINKSKKIHKDLYDYSSVSYINNTTKVDIICKKHGVFSITPSLHTNGKVGCKECFPPSEKIKKTNLLNYGAENPFQSEEIKEKIKKTNLLNYGVENPSQNSKIQLKKQLTCLKNYGVKYPSQNKQIHKNAINKVIQTKKDNHYTNIKQISPDDIAFLYNEKHYTIRKIARMMHVGTYEISKIFNKLNINTKKYVSQAEHEITNFIINHFNGTVIQSDRKLISPFELDIVIPQKKVAFEYNGLFWHSYDTKETHEQKMYHKHKSDLCKDINIQLIHISENDWINNKNITKSVILSKLGIYQNRIGARQTEIREVPNKKSKEFIEDNHLQGNCGSSVKYGLYYNGDLISLMTFGKARFNKNVDWELIRFCSKLHHQVYGAASKLLNHFRKNHKGSIISYSNNDYSDGGLYKKLGFIEHKPTEISYCYVKHNKVYNRINFQKHKLKNKLDKFDINITEAENMFNNGYRRMWDSGKRSWILN